MEQMRREFVSRPDLSVKATREMLARASGTDPLLPQDAKAYFERFGSFPANSRTRDFGYVAFLLAGVWNHLELGETAAAQALVGRGLAAVDQVSRGGSPSLGFLWTHQPDPPWGVLDRRLQPSLTPYSPLVPPILVAASVAYLKDLDAMAERLGVGPPPKRGGGGGGSGEQEEERPRRPPPKAKAKAKAEA